MCRLWLSSPSAPASYVLRYSSLFKCFMVLVELLEVNYGAWQNFNPRPSNYLSFWGGSSSVHKLLSARFSVLSK